MDSIFKTAATQRKKDQADINNKIDNKRKLDKINISIPTEYKDRLLKYCENNYISASAFLRQCIDEHC